MPGVARHYRFEGFCVDTLTRELRDRRGTTVPLSSRAFDTLCVLIERRHRIVTKDELMSEVWAGRVVEENNLTQAVSALRRALGTCAGDHRFVVTVPGHGYRFIADVDADRDAGMDGDGPGDAAREATPRDARARATRGPARSAIVLGAAAFLLALFAIAAWHYRTPTVPVPAAGATLAVLPFRPLAPGGGDELLELGLADTLVTRLSRSSDLQVRSLASSQRLGPSIDDPFEAGRRLNAAYVIDGTTQRRGDDIRVNVRLLSVERGATVWADTFDARAGRAFTLQDRVGDAVTRILGLRPVDGLPEVRSPCDGDDPSAYRALLRAQYRLQRRAPDTVQAFHQAIDVDPTCARAYAGLTMAYLFMTHNDGEPARLIPLARAASAQAIRLAPDSAEAQMARGRQLQLQEWDWARSEAALRQAIRINPSYADAHFSLAHLLMTTGRFDEGLAQARQAVALDPLSPLMVSLEAGFLTAARQDREAAARLDDALALQPDFWITLLVRGGMALDRGDSAAAIDDLERSAAQSRRASQVLAVLASAYVAAGRRGDAESLLRELQQRRRNGYVPATSVAGVQLALGDRAAALGELERAFSERDIRLVFMKVDARWNPLREEPRFRALADVMGLAGGPAHGRY